MYQDQINIFISTVYGKSEATRQLATLKSYLLNRLFSNDQSMLTSLEPEQIRWMQSLGEDFYQGINQTNVYQILQAIEEHLAQLEPLIIYLPFVLPDAQLPNLGKYARNLFGPECLVEIKFDPDLIAGPALVWKGVYKDYSIKQKLADHHQEIMDSLKLKLN
ncbi:hypothetical protein M1563_05300 [Patescibacteria group bacterium]|nr:hypothetical protein [Patescibacteria group bacterium]MCL5409308.1 hypothetical protein [Patescibacteria group bacterium]